MAKNVTTEWGVNIWLPGPEITTRQIICDSQKDAEKSLVEFKNRGYDGQVVYREITVSGWRTW